MKAIVIGSLNTDIVATGIKKFPRPGEHVYGKKLLIQAGGKSRNIADMLARLAGCYSLIGRAFVQLKKPNSISIDIISVATKKRCKLQRFF